MPGQSVNRSIKKSHSRAGKLYEGSVFNPHSMTAANQAPPTLPDQGMVVVQFRETFPNTLMNDSAQRERINLLIQRVKLDTKTIQQGA